LKNQQDLCRRISEHRWKMVFTIKGKETKKTEFRDLQISQTKMLFTIENTLKVGSETAYCFMKKI